MNFVRICPKCKEKIFYKNQRVLTKAIKESKNCFNCAHPKREKIEGEKFRYCPKCNKKIFYKNEKILNTSTKRNKNCRSCSVSKNVNSIENRTRQCPSCKKNILYSSKSAATLAHKQNTICKSCTQTKIHNDDSWKKKASETRKHNDLTRDKRKSVYDIWNEKYGKKIADQKMEQFKEKNRKNSSGKNNPMYRKSVYDIWIKKYGKEIADQKMLNHKEKQRKNMSGENNPMYGKPSPKGSNCGWSGYYKEYYFRSRYELYYLIYLTNNNIKFISAENNKFKVKYLLNNIERSYFPDFYLIDTEEIIEIKPERRLTENRNKLKFEAARKQFKEKFKILTEENLIFLNNSELYDIYLNGELKFLPKYEEKFLKSINKEGVLNE